MNILMPLAGQTVFDDGRIVPLLEVQNRTLLELVLGNLDGIAGRHVFVVKQEDCDRHHLDAVLGLLRPGSAIVRAPGPTRGQLCSCLLAIDHLAVGEPLLIVNGNQFVFADLVRTIEEFTASDADGGIVTFPSVHPRWSHARLDQDGVTVLETSEKRPISRHACAGVFWYRRAGDFLAAAQQVLRKRIVVHDLYFVSSTYNEMLLRGQKVRASQIPVQCFFGLHTAEGVAQFVSLMQERATLDQLVQIGEGQA